MTPGLMTRGRAAAAPSGSRPDERLRAPAARPLVTGPAVVAACIAALLMAVLCAIYADGPVARMAAGLSPRVERIAALGSALGNSNYMLVTSAVLALAAYAVRRRGGRLGAEPAVALLGERAAFVFATVASSGLLAQLIKHVVGRARPKLIETMGAFHFDWFSIKASLASLPSGHTASAFGLALALALMERRLAPVLLLLATGVAAARVVLGAHYLSDVVVGAALGSAVTLALAHAFADRGVAFERNGGAIRLKGDGAVWPRLTALVLGGGDRA